MKGKETSSKRVKRSKRDPRVTVSRFSWREFLVLWFLIMAITTGAILILSEFMPGLSLDIYATLSTLGYCALMALVASFLMTLLRRVSYEKPMRQLGEAARQVAEGDFNVRLTMRRKDDKKDYMDVMFEDFNTMVEELGSIETLKDDFVGNVSHEIKTPLATIENYASVLAKAELTGEERAEYTEAITEATKRLSTLVSNILRLNKLENQSIVPTPEPYDLAEQLRGCVLGFESAWEAKELNIEVDVDDQCFIDQDETLLEPVWNNLISNAIKFTPKGGTIKITERADSAQVSVEVSDTGSGMDEATQRRIFDKFYQGDTSHASEGNGLGLALAARALKLAEGEITVVSTPDEGTTFTVWLKGA